MGDGDCNTACLHIYHGGHFESDPIFLHAEGELTEAKMNMDYMSVEDIKGVVLKLGYATERIKPIYFCRLDVLFEESLVEIKNDGNIRDLMTSCERHLHVDLFVEHTDTYDDQ